MSSIRRLSATSLATAIALALPGCLQSESKITILADGSGTAVDVSNFDIAKTKDLVDAVKMFGGQIPGGGSVPADFDVEKFLEAEYGKAALEAQLKATAGVEAKSVTSEVKDGKRVAKREFAFADFSGLKQAAFQTTSAKLAKNDDGSWTLEMDALGMVRPLLPSAPPPGGAPDPSGGLGGFGFDPATLRQMVTEMVGDFRVKRTFTLPGYIVETNGVKAEDGKTVTWTFALKDIQNASDDPAKAPGKMTVRFKGEGLTLKPFGYAPSMKDAMKKPTTPAPVKPTEPAPTAPPAAPTTPKPPEPAPVR